MHTLLFLDPAHFHATLTLREPHPSVSPEVVVYAPEGPDGSEGPDVRDFLALVDRFNQRPERPTRWRPVVITTDDPLSRLIAERRGDVVVLAGRNGGKARTFRRLHEAGFHVLADKPWLVEPEDLADIETALGGWPLVTEIMTGRHDVAARLFKRLVDDRGVFGEFRADGPGVEIASVHQLEKLVDRAPLRRPPWFFDVRVQGGGAVDIPTHVVDQTQWLLDGRGVAPGEKPSLVSARAWTTPVPLEAFRRITGAGEFPAELRSRVVGDALRYACNAALEYRLGGVGVRAEVSWQLSTPPVGDSSTTIARGTRADVRMERTARTGYRRALTVEPHDDPGRVGAALADLVAAAQAELPGVGVVTGPDGRCEVTIPADLDGGHESHFVRVLDDLLALVDARRWPTPLVERTLAKYALLAAAAGRIRDADAKDAGAKEASR